MKNSLRFVVFPQIVIVRLKDEQIAVQNLTILQVFQVFGFQPFGLLVDYVNLAN